MESVSGFDSKPHVVCLPFPIQGHINPMLKLAKLLHFKGFYITFVNTEYNHKRLLKSRGLNSLDDFLDFKFETIPDGLPQSESAVDASQDIRSLCVSTSKSCLVPFLDLLRKLNSLVRISCVVSDACMSFSLDAAQELGIPEVVFWTQSPCGVLAYSQYRTLVDRGLVPLKDASYLTNGYMDTIVEGIPGLENLRLSDFPRTIRTTDINDTMVNFLIRETDRTSRAAAVILHTFDSVDEVVLKALSTIFPPIYTIGPLHSLVNQIPEHHSLSNLGSNLWKEDTECIKWLDSREPSSVVYVNFGSITVMTPQQMVEFAWGLANSNKPFLWIIRPDLVGSGTGAILPKEFMLETKDRAMFAEWCSQEKVLNHPAIGGFLSHMGWNSTLESISNGIPLICWPFYGEQQINCRFACKEWGIGMETNSNVKRDDVEKLIRELMEGDKGKEMKKNTMNWKAKLEEATRPGGSSYKNLNELVKFLQAVN